MHEIVIKLLEESPDHDPEEEQEKAEEAHGGEEGEGSEEGEGESEGGGEGGELSDEDGGEGSTKSKVSYKDIMGHLHGGDSSKGGFSSEIIYDHDTTYDYVPWEDMEVTKARDLEPTRGREVTFIRALYEEGRNLASIARRLFQSRTQSRISHNHKRGRLDKRDLYRVPSGAVDVFKRKEKTPDPKGTAIFLLTDAAGGGR